MFGTVGFAFAAGLLSTLSPCVLPLLPLVLGAAVSEHRFGPVMLAIGLALSFTSVGLFVATVGFAVGLDNGVFRNAAAIVMAGIGIVLIVPRFQAQFAAVSGPIGNWAEEQLGGISPAGLSGQFAVGMLLGLVWAPCVGPTLGAASVLAAKGESLGQVAVTMLAFGIGAGLPLLLLGAISRETMKRVRGRLVATARASKLAMGAVLIAIGLVILTGVDRNLEEALVDASPAWLTNLTTRF